MLIKTKKGVRNGSGNVDYKETIVNIDEISSATVCDYSDRPFQGCLKLSMNNGDKFYTTLRIDEIVKEKEQNNDAH